MLKSKIYIFILLTFAGLAAQALFPSVASAAYVTSGTVTSTNLLSGTSASSITNFHYNLSYLPSTSSVTVQFSTTSTAWYSSAGVLNGSDTLSTTGGADLSLAGMALPATSAFYYKMTINATSNQADSPTIDDIRLDYVPTGGYGDMLTVNSTTGNIGIGSLGSNAASSKLSVLGGGTFGYDYFTTTAPTNGLLVEGNVGLGTTSPWGLLSLAALSSNTSPLFTISTSTASATSTAFIIDSNGKVGIGMASPTAQLSVNGTASSTLLYVSSLGTAAGTFLAADANGQLIATTSPISSITADYPLTGNGTSGSHLTLAFGTTTANTWSGVQTFSTLPVLGTLSGFIAGNAGTLYQVASSSIFGFTPASNAISINTSFPFSGGGDLTTSRTLSWIGLATTSQPSSSNLFVSDGTNGMYGVATTSPTFGLGLTVGGTWAVLGSSPTLNIATSSLYSGSTGQFPYFSGANTLTATSSVFLAASGFFGIGTSTPARLLDIANNGSTGQILLEDTAATTDQHYWGFTVSRGNFAISSLTDALATTTRLFINSSGYIGIGTTSPQTSLHIGTASTTQMDNLANGLLVSGQAEFQDNTYMGQLQFPTDAGAVTWADMTVDSSASNLTVESYTASINASSTLTLFSQADGGGYVKNVRVGIASTTPWARLSIDTSTIDSSTPSFVISSSTATNFIVAEGGNVGIGVASPSYDLDVAGIINTDQYSGYYQNGSLLAYASSTNQDVLFGLQSGGNNATTSATVGGNTAVGYQAMNALTTGQYNTALGWNALLKGTSASYNNAIGYGAMASSTVTGNGYNNAMGYQALRDVTSGGNNNAIGDAALTKLSTGSYNNALGYNALGTGIVTGSYNNAIGTYALVTASSAKYNNAIGYAALDQATSGSYNNALGYQSLYNLTTGVLNTAIGSSTLYDLTTGYDNIMIGDEANIGGNSVTTGWNNIMLGYNSQIGTTTSTHNFLNIGNSFFGELVATTSSNTLPTTMAGIAFGIATSSFNNNTFSVQNASSANNILSLFSSTGTSELTVQDNGNVGIGTTTPQWLLNPYSTSAAQLSLAGGIGIAQWAFRNAGGNLYLATTTTAGTATTSTSAFTILSSNGNVGIGTSSPNYALDVNGSAAFGTGSEAMRIDANGLLGLGTSTPQWPFQLATTTGVTAPNGATIALSDTGAGLNLKHWLMTSMGGNFYIGTSSDAYATSTASNLTVTRNGYFGISSSSPGVALEVKGTIRQTGAISCANGTVTDAQGGFTSCVASDARLKTDIATSTGSALVIIDQLNPVEYRWRDTAMRDDLLHTGFIAQAVQKVFPTAIDSGGFDTAGNALLSIDPNAMNALLAKGVQELDARFTIPSGAGSMPSAVLTADGKGIDLFKLATFAVSTSQALSDKIGALDMQMTSLDARVTALENGSVSTASGSPMSFSSSSLASALSGFSVFIQKGIAQFGTLVADQFVAATNSRGSSSAGTVTILAGNTVAQISNDYVLPTSKIFVTLTASTTGSWYISDKQAGSFKLVLSEAQANDVSFDYFIVQTEGQIATSTAQVLGSSDKGQVNSLNLTPSTLNLPVITLLGDNPVHISVGGVFTDPGVDTGGLAVTTYINGVEREVSASTIDTSSPTTYLITYKATDTAGNTATAMRSVIVGNPDGTVNTGAASSKQCAGDSASCLLPPADSVPPVVTLKGDAAMQINVGDAFADPGATATDDTDGDLTTHIKVSGAVDTATAGLYTLTYSATDAAGNVGSASRVVTVINSEPVESVIPTNTTAP